MNPWNKGKTKYNGCKIEKCNKPHAGKGFCNPHYLKEYFKNNVEKVKNWDIKKREQRRKFRKEILDAYGGKCVCCGIDIFEFLALDHINNDGAKHKRENNIKDGYQLCKWAKKNNYPKNLQILCHNCNCAKGFYKQCPHLKCELCGFSNPKGTVTGIIIKDNKVLLLKRNEEPFKGMWDFPGGYMNEKETLEQAMIREITEELYVTPGNITFMREEPGAAFWKNKEFPIVSHFYLIDISNQEIKLNDENSEYQWYPLKDLKKDIIPTLLAWDSNQNFCGWLHNNFTFDLKRIKELIRQLDSNAKVEEQNLYEAILNGFVSKKYDENGILVGMGWIFPRQTALRCQAVIEDMIVDESQRGKGLGYQILDELCKWAKDKGVEVIELTTNPKRFAAHALYEKYGFKLHVTDHMLLNL